MVTKECPEDKVCSCSLYYQSGAQNYSNLGPMGAPGIYDPTLDEISVGAQVRFF